MPIDYVVPQQFDPFVALSALLCLRLLESFKTLILPNKTLSNFST